MLTFSIKTAFQVQLIALCGIIAVNTIIIELEPQVKVSQQGEILRRSISVDENPQNFHEVDAFGDDYVDFGARTGSDGAFFWHANYPVEERKERSFERYESNSNEKNEFDYHLEDELDNK
ncbi:uncharacterized protein LOC129748287 [Uranotaenia lowii]|uniref:uncharacterized protein LOC129748287 n=1 Tax=Uranotaenia lowii TaxID=190385 RepID=UPI0024793F4C|nr:uncharacterized protein LOC129748287 [Uranotaenia lowii]